MNEDRTARRPREMTGLEALWRPSSGFIGPVAPPMWLWTRDREKQAAWRIACNLSDVRPSVALPDPERLLAEAERKVAAKRKAVAKREAGGGRTAHAKMSDSNKLECAR